MNSVLSPEEATAWIADAAFGEMLLHGTMEDSCVEAIRRDGFKPGSELRDQGSPAIWLTDSVEVARYYACEAERRILRVACRLERPFIVAAGEADDSVRRRLAVQGTLRGGAFLAALTGQDYDGLVMEHRPGVHGTVEPYRTVRVFDAAACRLVED